MLASKFFTNLFPGDPNGGGAGRSSIIAQLHETLRRLRTDYLDLYWLHNWDRHTPIEETMRTLDDLVRARHDPLHRVLQHAGLGHRAGPDHGAAAGLDTADRAAGRVLAAGAHRGGRTRTAGARPGHGAGAVEPAEERLPVRQVPARQSRSSIPPAPPTSAARATTSSSSSTPSPPSPTSSETTLPQCRWPGCGPAKAPSCPSWVPGGWPTSKRTSPGSTSTLSPEHLGAARRGLGPDAELPGVDQRRDAGDAAVRGHHRRRRVVRHLSAAAGRATSATDRLGCQTANAARNASRAATLSPRA